MLEDKGKIEYLAALRIREASLGAKARGKLSVKNAWALAIGLTLQSALSMEQRREKVEPRKGREGALLVVAKVMQLLVYPKGRRL